jgi:hypothetical protein
MKEQTAGVVMLPPERVAKRSGFSALLEFCESTQTAWAKGECSNFSGNSLT